MAVPATLGLAPAVATSLATLCNADAYGGLDGPAYEQRIDTFRNLRDSR